MSTPGIVVKPFGKKHFTKKFDEWAFSDRIILPAPDGARVKVTQFSWRRAAEFKDIVYAVDETVYVVSGRVLLTVGEETYELGPGSTYYAQAGVKYSVKVMEGGGMLFCVFSQAGSSGPLPDNE